MPQLNANSNDLFPTAFGVGPVFGSVSAGPVPGPAQTFEQPGDGVSFSPASQDFGSGPLSFDASPLLQALGMDSSNAQAYQLEMEIENLLAQLQQAMQSHDSNTAQSLENQLQQLESQLAGVSSPSPSMTGSGGGYGGGGGYGAGDSVGGGSPLGGNAGGGSINTSTAGISTSGSGGQAVAIAESKLGQQSSNVKMANYTAAGGVDNDCADFVSGCIADAGMYHKEPGDASVATFKQHLQQQGWVEVPKAQAQPGDVAIFNGSQHTELVAAPGATKLIGSNNGGTNVQHISTDSGNWGTVQYFHKP